MSNNKKAKAMKAAMISLIFLVVISSCEEDEQDYKCPIKSVEGSVQSILGKWKLAKTQTPFVSMAVNDYSCSNIIYSFNSNDVLTIDSDVENYIGGESSGEYQYEFSVDNQNNPVLKVNNVKHSCIITKNSMVWNDAYLDGPILEFVRVETPQDK